MSTFRRCHAVAVFFLAVLAVPCEAAMVFLKARLDGAQASVSTTADGAAFLSYDTSTRLLTWAVNYRNLSGILVAAHFHGPAARGVDAGVQVPIDNSASPMIGSATLSPAQETDMLGGLWYVNLHTPNFPNGEIRGQLELIDTTLYTVSLDGAQAGTAGAPNATTARGSGVVNFDPATRQLTWSITYSGLTSAVTAAHFHGPANAFEVAGVVVPTDTASPIRGSAALNATSAADFVNGFYYHNIHSANFPSGEIRGQVLAVHPHLGAISTRLQVLTGDNVMIGGFIVGGATPKTVLVRARGTSTGVAGALVDPTLTLVPANGDPATTNDDWGNAPNAALIAASGSAPGDAKESAILATLNPGAYTAIVSGVGNSLGVAIAEIFEVDHPDVPLTGISTRGLVQTGDNVIIGGFIIGGTSPQTVVIRGRGPSLTASGIANALADPTLTLVRASDAAVVATNDNWATDANAARLSASGFAPGDSRESALFITLDPGAYTAIVAGARNTSGVGIVEVFAAP